MTRICIAGALIVGLSATSAAATCPANKVREYNPETNRDLCMSLDEAQTTRDRRFAEEQVARARRGILHRMELDEARRQHRRRAQQRQHARTLQLLRDQRSRGR